MGADITGANKTNDNYNIGGARLYWRFLLMHLKSQMQYKASFALALFGRFLATFTVFLGMRFMFLRFNAVEGFTFEQALLCYAIAITGLALPECFGRGFDVFPTLISNGQFDRALVRPRNEILLVLASTAEFSRLGGVAQAVFMLVYALPRCGVHWTLPKALTLSFMIAGGVAVFSGLFLLYAAVSFWTIQGLEFMNIFIYGGNEFGRYPYSIYGKRVLFFVTFVVPLALAQYYPLLFLLDRAPTPLYALTPLGCFLFPPLAWLLWRAGLRRYVSTGS